jgi:hypothetical protein
MEYDDDWAYQIKEYGYDDDDDNNNNNKKKKIQN